LKDVHVRRAVAWLFLGLGAPTGCAAPTAPVTSAAASTQRGNPASENCARSGGTLSLERDAGGGTYGVCTFADNRQCEEWALLRGQCPSGGIAVTGYVTASARYCAITGGRYAVTAGSNTPSEEGTCTFSTGTSCDAGAYHRGQCTRH
jgi:putative hemolysin